MNLHLVCWLPARNRDAAPTDVKAKAEPSWRDSAIRAGGAQTDVGRQNGRFSTAGPAVRIRLSGESGANLNSAS
jgi:hypothetical protein